MCFSATASFTVSAVLTVVGVYSVFTTLQHRTYRFLAIAFIPILFAIQQSLEGFVWLYWQPVFIWSYLFFAYFFWPVWVPFALLIFERKKKVLFLSFLVWGIIVGGLSYGYLLWNPNEVQAKIVSHSICYRNSCLPNIFKVMLYGLATIVPPLFSSSRKIQFLGILFAVSAIVSYIVYYYAFASVWCFFAAIISIFIAWTAEKSS